MVLKTENAKKLYENRHLIIQRLVAHKTIREIANEIGTTYGPLYNYLITGKILEDKGKEEW